MSIALLSAGMVSAAMLFNTDSIILDKSLSVLGAGITMVQGPESHVRPEFSLYSVPLEDYYTGFSRKPGFMSLGLPDVRLGLRYTPSDTGYSGVLSDYRKISSTLYYIQGGYSVLPGAGKVYRVGAGLWDHEVGADSYGLIAGASLQEVALDNGKVENFRSASLGFGGATEELPMQASLSLRYAEDRPDISIVRTGLRSDGIFGADVMTTRSHRKVIDAVVELSLNGCPAGGLGWYGGLDINLVAGGRTVLAWEDLPKAGKRRLVGVVDGDSVTVDDGFSSLIASASTQLTVGHGWEVPHLHSLIMLSGSIRGYISGADYFMAEVLTQDPDRDTKDGGLTYYKYTLRPNTRYVGYQLSWGLSIRF